MRRLVMKEYYLVRFYIEVASDSNASFAIYVE